MVSQVVFTWVNYYPEAACTWLLSTSEHQWLLPAVLAKWTKFDHVAALKSLANIHNQEVKISCQSAIVVEWGYFNPERASKWANENLKGEQLSDALQVLIGNWVADYPLDVLKWAKDIDQENHNSTMMELSLETWAFTDYKPCLHWLNQQIKGHNRDFGLSKVSDVLMETEPETAIDVALYISGIPLQKKSVLKILRTWKLNSPENLENWTKNHPNIQKLLNQ